MRSAGHFYSFNQRHTAIHVNLSCRVPPPAGYVGSQTTLNFNAAMNTD